MDLDEFSQRRVQILGVEEEWIGSVAADEQIRQVPGIGEQRLKARIISGIKIAEALVGLDVRLQPIDDHVMQGRAGHGNASRTDPWKSRKEGYSGIGTKPAPDSRKSQFSG